MRDARGKNRCSTAQPIPKALLIAVVTPIPSLSSPVTMPLVGAVKTSIANVFYMGEICSTPFHDDVAGNATCIGVESAGNAYVTNVVLHYYHFTDKSTQATTTSWLTWLTGLH